MMADQTVDNEKATGHLRGSVLLVAGRALAILINFGVQMLTVRYLAKGDYGILAFALSVAGVLAVLSSFGMDKAVSRFVAVYHSQGNLRRFWGALILMTATICACGLFSVAFFTTSWACGWPVLASEPETRFVLAIIAGLAWCNALDGLLIALFAVLTNPLSIFFRRHLLGPVLKLAAALLVIFAQGGLVAFATGQLVAALLGVALSVMLFVRILQQDADLRPSRVPGRFEYPAKELFSYSATLLSGDLAFLMRGALVPVVLGMAVSKTDVATFQSVVPLARLNEFVLVTFSVLFLPQAAKLVAARRDRELQHLYESTTLWVTLLSVPVFAVSFLASDSLPVLLFGREYGSSGSILAWLAIGYFVNASFGTNLRLLRSSARLRCLLAADMVLIVVASLLVLTLVPLYGAAGGAWAVCGTYVFQSLLYQVLVARTTTVNPYTWKCLAPGVAVILLCLVGLLARDLVSGGLWFSLPAAVVVSAIVWLSFGRDLEILATFPELSKLPLLPRGGRA